MIGNGLGVIFDMDGVLTDFVSATLTLHGRAGALATWPAGERDIPAVLGISPRTADNDWAYARAWLVTALHDVD